MAVFSLSCSLLDSLVVKCGFLSGCGRWNLTQQHLASIMQMSRQLSRSSAGEYQADERASVAGLAGEYQADEQAVVTRLRW